HHARQDLQKRGLAGTVLPQYGTGLARPDLEGDLPENPVRPVTLIYVPQCERGCRHCALLRLRWSTAEARPPTSSWLATNVSCTLNNVKRSLDKNRGLLD